MIDELLKKWTEETGVEPSIPRLRRAMKFLKRRRLGYEQVRFEQHQDPKWNTYQCRLPHERAAECVGFTNARKKGDRAERWWVVPIGREPVVWDGTSRLHETHDGQSTYCGIEIPAGASFGDGAGHEACKNCARVS